MQRKRMTAGVMAIVCISAGVACDPQVGESLMPTPDPIVNDPNVPTDPIAPQDPPAESPTRTIKGVWQRESGKLSVVDPFFGDVQFITFEEAGVMRLSIRDPETNILHCQDAVFSQLSDDTIIMDGVFDQSSVARAFFGPRVAIFDMPDDNTLSLMDDTKGDAVVLRRVETVPDESVCESPAIVAEFTELEEPRFASGLVFDGVSLWYTRDSDNQVIPVDPVTGGVGGGIIQSGSFRYVHAAQEGSFWNLCNCGSPDVAQRRSAADVLLDQITSTEIGFNFDVDSLAFDAANKIVWMQGFDDDDEPVIVEVDAESEPDVVLSTTKFDFTFDAMAHDGAFLYGLSGFLGVIIQIDPATMQAVATIQMPVRRIDWQGLAIVDGDFFVLGEEFDDDDGVIVRLNRE